MTQQKFAIMYKLNQQPSEVLTHIQSSRASPLQASERVSFYQHLEDRPAQALDMDTPESATF